MKHLIAIRVILGIIFIPYFLGYLACFLFHKPNISFSEIPSFDMWLIGFGVGCLATGLIGVYMLIIEQ